MVLGGPARSALPEEVVAASPINNRRTGLLTAVTKMKQMTMMI
jgi:hypothetical protein